MAVKVGILTHYNVYNHGAQLQMYALKYWLERHGHDVTILTYEKNFDFDKEARKKNSGSFKNYKYYLKHYLQKKGIGLTLFNTEKVLVLQNVFKTVPTAPYDESGCDAVIIGSDEVFSIDVGCNRMMYGHGLGSIPAVAYAPAFGRTTLELLKEYGCYDLVKDGLGKMYALSARDSHTREMIAALTGRDVPVVCDPVILYDCERFRVRVKPVRKKYLLVYSYSRHMVDENEIREIKAYACGHGLLTVSVGTYHSWCDRNIVCDARQWYSYFRDADCVVTDTFHGAVAAMKNHCNLAVYVRQSVNGFKMESLLQNAGLESRRLGGITASELERVLSASVDYEQVDRKLAELAKASEAYLITALEKIHEQ